MNSYELIKTCIVSKSSSSHTSYRMRQRFLPLEEKIDPAVMVNFEALYVDSLEQQCPHS